MANYLCTCGTSAGKNLKEHRLNAEWVSAQGGTEAAAAKILETFEHAAMTDEKALRRTLSAEIHSLARMGVGGADRVVLFSSETDDGQSCAQAVQKYLQQQISGLACSVDEKRSRPLHLRAR